MAPSTEMAIIFIRPLFNYIPLLFASKFHVRRKNQNDVRFFQIAKLTFFVDSNLLDKSEVGERQNLSERGTLVPQIRAGLIHKRD